MPGFNVSVSPIIAATEDAAWDKANRILAGMTGKKGWSRQEETSGPVDNAGKRLMSFALQSDIHDARLWMPIARATGALGNTSCLVGTPEQVTDYIVRLKQAGIDGIQLAFYDFKPDLTFFGDRVLPLLHQAGLRH